MKKVVLAFVVLFVLILIAKPANAQIIRCTLGPLDVVNDISADLKAHSKATWYFSCHNITKNFGQMTKMVYSIPLTDVSNFEASDNFGTMKVLEGPAYATATPSTRGSILGVIFRKPILLSDEDITYTITDEFDSSTLVSAGENGTFSLMPGKQIANPKVTIVTTGVTETIYPIEVVSYELNLPSGASVQTLAKDCTLSSGKIICQNLNQSAFNSLEIKWAKPISEKGGLLGKIREKMGKLLPSFTNVFKGISGSLIKVVKGK